MSVLFLALTCVLGLLWLVQRLLATERVPMNQRLRAQAPGNFVKLGDGVTHYKIIGERHRALVVLVPGATLPTWVWNYLDVRLADAGYCVLVYDLFGRGFSDRPGKRYDLKFHRKQLRELLDTLFPGREAHVVCLAFGTLISADFIGHDAQKRVKSLTAIGPDGFGVVMVRQAASWLMNVPVIRDYVFSLVGTKILMSRIPAYSTSAKVVKELEELYRPTLNWKGFKRSILSSVKHMPIHDARTQYARVSSMKTPVMLIWGKEDAVTPYPGEDAVRSVFPDADLTLVQGGGHLPHYEDPEETAAKIISFLKRVDAQKESQTAFARHPSVGDAR